MRAVIYARYSSDLQREASIEDQIEVCRRYAQQNGWAMVGHLLRCGHQRSQPLSACVPEAPCGCEPQALRYRGLRGHRSPRAPARRHGRPSGSVGIPRYPALHPVSRRDNTDPRSGHGHDGPDGPQGFWRENQEGPTGSRSKGTVCRRHSLRLPASIRTGQWPRQARDQSRRGPNRRPDLLRVCPRKKPGSDCSRSQQGGSAWPEWSPMVQHHGTRPRRPRYRTFEQFALQRRACLESPLVHQGSAHRQPGGTS